MTELFNSHVHTDFSADCTITGEAMCESAIAHALSGITITDHSNLASCISHNAFRTSLNSVLKARELKEKYRGRLQILAGIEMGDALCMPDYAGRIIRATKPDFVLASVHSVPFPNKHQYINKIDYPSMADKEIDSLIRLYFKLCLQTVKESDFDSFAHLTIPFRYINGVSKKNVDIRPYYDIINEILKNIVARKKALELNTSELSRQLFDFMPNEEIINMYKACGGSLVTIGSVAHVPENIAFGLSDALSLLKRAGFTSYVYYKNRESVEVPIL